MKVNTFIYMRFFASGILIRSISTMMLVLIFFTAGFSQFAIPGSQTYIQGASGGPEIEGNDAWLELTGTNNANSVLGLEFSNNSGAGQVTEALLYYKLNSNRLHFGPDANVANSVFSIHADDGNVEIGGEVNVAGDGNFGGVLDITGGLIALRVDGDEAIWHNEDYYSWGFGGTYNYFAKSIKIGGSGGTAPNYQLVVTGNADITGELTAASDERLKKNIEPIEDAVKLVSRLNPVYYDFRSDEFPSLELSDRHKMGLIAQEVEEVFPALVSNGSEVTDINGFSFYSKSVNYMELIPLLTKAIQEQQTIIEAQNNDISSIRLEMAQLVESMSNVGSDSSKRKVNESE